MEKSTLYNLLSMGIVQKWRSEIEESETNLKQSEEELLSELKTVLGEDGIALLSNYSLAVENRTDCLNFGLNIKILNLGIKIGMELNKAFNEYKQF